MRKNIELKFLHVSAMNRKNIQTGILLEVTCNMLCNLSAVNDEIRIHVYTCDIIPHLVNNYQNHIKIVI
jgi:hypothetical protein